MAGALPFLNHGTSTTLALSTSDPKHHPLLSRRPMSKNNQSYWTSITADIDTRLKQAIPIKPPLVFFEPLHHLTFAAPHTSAPALCIAACELVGGHRDQALAAASTLHLMYASAFTHDNIPLTDRPRRSIKPANGHAYGPNIALLIGDAMIPFGFELLAKTEDPAQNNSDRLLRVIIEISRAVGSQGMKQGQYNRLQYSGWEGKELLQLAWLNQVCKKKEGELHACAAACGAILGGGSEGEIEKLRRYGLYVGIIKGLLNGFGHQRIERKEEWSLKKVDEIRDLAIKELKDFNEEKVEAISSLLEYRNMQCI